MNQESFVLLDHGCPQRILILNSLFIFVSILDVIGSLQQQQRDPGLIHTIEMEGFKLQYTKDEALAQAVMAERIISTPAGFWMLTRTNCKM